MPCWLTHHGCSKELIANLAALGVRAQFASTSFAHLAVKPEQTLGTAVEKGVAFSPGPIDFWDLAVSQVTIGSSPTALGAGHLEPSIGITGDNLARLANWGAFLLTLSQPWVILADWNATPAELAATGWPDTVGGTVVTPSNADRTCSRGQRRLPVLHERCEE